MSYTTCIFLDVYMVCALFLSLSLSFFLHNTLSLFLSLSLAPSFLMHSLSFHHTTCTLCSLNVYMYSILAELCIVSPLSLSLALSPNMCCTCKWIYDYVLSIYSPLYVMSLSLLICFAVFALSHQQYLPAEEKTNILIQHLGLASNRYFTQVQ